jgi:hypothetical protein
VIHRVHEDGQYGFIALAGAPDVYVNDRALRNDWQLAAQGSQTVEVGREGARAAP